MLTQLQDHSEDVRASEQNFSQLAESIGAVFWLADLPKSRVIYVSPSYEKIWGRTCDSLYVSPDDWTDSIHLEDRDRVLDNISARQAAGTFDEEYRIIRPDGSVRWIRARAFPVLNELGHAYRVAGIAEDITGRKRMEQEIIETSDRELSQLGRDLHDGICQQLVSIAFATDLVRRDLVSKSPSDAVRVARITALLDNAITQARNLSHTLSPVSLAGSGLGVALRELAGSIRRGHSVACEVDCHDSVVITDQTVATHLYRITQEALQNAVKYSHATRISISLCQDGEMFQLAIKDDGIEADESDVRNYSIGINIMQYRAGMAGGTISVRNNPAGGTTITCHIPGRAI